MEQLEERTLLSIGGSQAAAAGGVAEFAPQPADVSPATLVLPDKTALGIASASTVQSPISPLLSATAAAVEKQLAGSGTVDTSEFSDAVRVKLERPAPGLRLCHGRKRRRYLQLAVPWPRCRDQQRRDARRTRVAPAGSLEALAQVPGVTQIAPPVYAVAQAGAVTTAGDDILRADAVRSQFAAQGIDGTGIKIGVISGGASHYANSQATGDLPSAVTIDPSRPGSGDEGTAMMEIVHDLAPGAELFFSGPSTSTNMVNSINWLVGQGCKVIMDNVEFLRSAVFSGWRRRQRRRQCHRLGGGLRHLGRKLC